MQRQHFLRAAAAATLALACGASFAQAWPARPVKMIIPFPPGGTLDTVGRLLAQKLQEQLGQTFIVENRAGGNGMIGADAVAKAPADGYTLLIASPSSISVNPALNPKLSYSAKDLVPVTRVTSSPLVVVAVNPKVGIGSIQELIAAAKNERYYSELQSNLNTLQAKIQQNHSGYMARFREEIQKILELEIAFHYDLDKGRVEAGLESDKELAEAKRILRDNQTYQKFLAPH